MQYQLDLRAYRCPIPLLSAKKALAELQGKDQLILQLNAESAVENFEIFCEENGCELISYQMMSEDRFQVILEKIGEI